MIEKEDQPETTEEKSEKTEMMKAITTEDQTIEETTIEEKMVTMISQPEVEEMTEKPENQEHQENKENKLHVSAITAMNQDISPETVKNQERKVLMLMKDQG